MIPDNHQVVRLAALFLVGFALLGPFEPSNAVEPSEAVVPSGAGLFSERIRPLMTEYCLDCHEFDSSYDAAQALTKRELWKKAYDMLDAEMMPPPKQTYQPSRAERASLLSALEEYLTLPDPVLGRVNPGKPIVSRLNRLQYNNTVRDLFGLDHDVFMLPDRLPTRRHSYYAEEGGLPDSMIINIREFGSKYTVLLPMSGLPGENRVAHGFNNRGDAMNVSPLQLEKYVSIAGELVNHPSLPLESPRFRGLLGQDIDAYCGPGKSGRGGVLVDSASMFAAKDNVPASAPGNDFSLSEFRRKLHVARPQGRAALFDLPEPFQKAELFDSGGLIAVKYGLEQQKRFTINPSLGITVAPYAGAKSTANGLCLMNAHATEKYFDLVIRADANDPREEIRSLGLCVLDLKGDSGYVTVTVTLNDHQRISRTANIREGSGNTFFGFKIPPGSSAVNVTVDGAAYGGKFVALGDIAVVTGPAKTGAPSLRDPWNVNAYTQRGWKDQSPHLRLRHFLSDAFRRPATTEEVNRFHQIYLDAEARGESGADAMRITIQSVLSSPQFLFRIETEPADEMPVRALNDFEVANRLSYFLWASMPDRALFDTANRGRLNQPAELEAHVKRMMRDPKIRELCETFAVQWLRLDQIYATQPDRDVFKAFYRDRLEEDTLHDDMILEAVLLFETILVEDRSILDLIDADFSWLNANLLDIYELKGLNKGLLAETPVQLRKSVKVTNRSNYNLWHRVALPDKTRGGVVTMGGPLTLTSTPLRTSPIKRGNWLLETIYNRPPPEPKMAFVLKEEEGEQASEPKTLRERFEMHRSDDACYTCHSRIDPLGFALEAFDPIGRLREKDNGVPVDASGTWNGKDYRTPVEFKAALMERPEDFVRGFIEHLLSYAIGRKLEYYDMATVNDIQQKLEARGYRFSELIFEIVKSDPFRNTGTHREPESS
ncbi:MAG: DUF1592 domain-containing protein [Planctomycetota bacterium]